MWVLVLVIVSTFLLSLASGPLSGLSSDDISGHPTNEENLRVYLKYAEFDPIMGELLPRRNRHFYEGYEEDGYDSSYPEEYQTYYDSENLEGYETEYKDNENLDEYETGYDDNENRE